MCNQETQVLKRCLLLNSLILVLGQLCAVYFVWRRFGVSFEAITVGIVVFATFALFYTRLIEKSIDQMVYKLHNQ
jgi:uncharacterized membrane protein YhfC